MIVGVIIKHQDAKAARMCNRGQRLFAKIHGVDYMDFLRNGIDSDRLPQDDAMVQTAIANAVARVQKEDGNVVR